MRLWHYALIPYLPNSQLVAQWRELNSIFKKQDKHILINYVYEYDKDELGCYSCIILDEMYERGFKYKLNNFWEYFKCNEDEETSREMIYIDLLVRSRANILLFKNHHTDRYLLQCFYNLQEKYDRGQKDFSKEQYEKLEEFIKSKGLIQ